MSTGKAAAKGWTVEARDKAVAAHQYIKVGDKGGHLLLSGAPNRWKKPEHAGDVYVSTFRVAGPEAAVRNYLVAAGQDANAALAQAYRASNYATTMKAAFDAEVAAYKAYKDSRAAVKAASGDAVQLDRLDYYVDNLSAAKERTKAASPKSPRRSPRKSPAKKAPAKGKGRGKGKGKGKRASPRKSPRATRGPTKSLMQRVQEAAAAGKVVDVSKMTAAGTGARTIPAPGPKAKKVGVAGLALVSDNAASFATAVRMLGPEYEGYIARYGVAASPAASPRGSPRPAPLPATSPVVGGSALPPVPGALPTFPAIGSPGRSPAL